MNLSKITKQIKSVEVQGIKFTVKKFPLSFQQHLQLKYLEGKKFNTDNKGQATSIEKVGKYDPEIYAEQLFYGLRDWELLDDKNYGVELTLGNCLSLVLDYPELAEEIITEIVVFNSGVDEETKKK